MQAAQTTDPLAARISNLLTDFTDWLDDYGEKSWDFQSFFAGPVGGRAKALYYRHKLIGTAAVAPMIFCEALVPAARRLFYHPMRFPIADAHYAMGFAFLYELTSDLRHLERATHFLNELVASRCHDFKEYCWGYPFDWVWHGGVIKAQTPLITSTPYAYEAFLQVHQILQAEDRGQRSEDGGRRADGRGPVTAAKQRPGFQMPDVSDRRHPSSDFCPLDLRDEYAQIIESIARHAANDIKDFRVSEAASSCSYTPFDEGGVVNAAAYRAFLLTNASRMFSNDDYLKTAERNLNFVLENQNADGSWFYAVDGVRDFVDHFHTCFVMKALAKIHLLTGDRGCDEALTRGVGYYLANLFDQDGLPKPFSRAPRLTVYKRELYDCAECINLCLLLRDRFPQLKTTLQTVIEGVLRDWIKPDGSFRSRRLHFGWDNVPMHRWGQSQMFRSLAFYVRETARTEKRKSDPPKRETVRFEPLEA
jgi:hypothetical protein